MRLGGLIIAVVLAGTASVAPARAEASKPGDFRITAHRGAPTSEITENTLRSMRRAIRLKASAVELDVRMTKDGQFVLLHDPTLDRTTDCRGQVDERSMHYLRKHCRGSRGGELVPTLGAVLRLAARKDANVLMEFKGQDWPRADVARLGRTVVRAGMQRRLTAMSFHPAPLRRIEGSHPGIASTLLVRQWAQVAEALTYADGVTIPVGQMTRRRVDAVRAAGAWVIAKKANSRSRWRQLKRLQVGDLITDRISGYRDWLHR